jgi:hypothetical protein
MKWNEEEEVGRRCVVDGVVIVGVDGVDGVLLSVSSSLASLLSHP